MPRSANLADVETVLAHRHDNGGDFWAGTDGRIYVGNPYSTISALGMLYELGVGGKHEAVAGGLDRLLAACRPDGRIRVGPKAPLYPCYTAEAVRMLCRYGLGRTTAVRAVIAYLEGSAHESGGWRCEFSRFGRGPETRLANPGATLFVLDALRFLPAHRKANAVVDRAVESLLDHWDARQPTGPCHYGIGTQFLRIEYPFIRYNLFFYVYVLSFFHRARRDRRFRAALEALRSTLSPDGAVIVARPHRGLKELRLCAKGQPSALATRRYEEVLGNLRS